MRQARGEGRGAGYAVRILWERREMRELGEQGGLGGKVEGAALQHLRSACSVLVLCCGSSRLG